MNRRQISIRLPEEVYEIVIREASNMKRTINSQIIWWMEIGRKNELARQESQEGAENGN